MTRRIRVPQLTNKQTDQHMKTSLAEVARSLERELSLLAEERRDRALRLGIDMGLFLSNTNK